jgi:hypothetical protein
MPLTVSPAESGVVHSSTPFVALAKDPAPGEARSHCRASRRSFIMLRSPLPAGAAMLVACCLSLAIVYAVPQGQHSSSGPAQGGGCTGKSARLAATECAAFGDFYDATGGARWAPFGEPLYCSKTDPCSCCGHSFGNNNDGVKCNKAGTSVIEINLQGSGLTGTLPESIGNLTSMQQFFVPDNALNGSLPSTLAKWTKLRGFFVYGNSFSGGLLPNLPFNNLGPHPAGTTNFYFPRCVLFCDGTNEGCNAARAQHATVSTNAATANTSSSFNIIDRSLAFNRNHYACPWPPGSTEVCQIGNLDGGGRNITSADCTK